MHLIGSIENFKGALTAIHFREWDVLADPEPPVHLNGPVNHIAGNPRSDNSDGRDLGFGRLGPTLMNHLGGLHGQKTCLLDFDPRFGNPLPDRTLIGKWSTECHPRIGSLDHESVTFGCENVGCGNPDIFEPDPRMAVLVLPTEDGE